MILKEYLELMQMLNNVKDRVVYVGKLFPAYPSTTQIAFGLAQKKALKEIDESWDKFKQRAKELNTWTNEATQGQLKV